MTSSIRLIVADDHPLFRKGMVSMLQAVDEFEVLGEAATGEETVALTRQLLPDVVLMDLHMPNMSGIEATREIHAFQPDVRILVVTMLEDDDSVFLSLRAGAQGYVLKDAQEEEFVRAIRAVAAGEAIFSPAIARRVLSWFESRQRHASHDLGQLTHREREILDELALGHGNATIARHLSISSKTVANHLSSIFAKLQVADRGAAIVRAPGGRIRQGAVMAMWKQCSERRGGLGSSLPIASASSISVRCFVTLSAHAFVMIGRGNWQSA